MKKLFYSFIFYFICLQVYAQTAERRINITILGGLSEYAGDQGTGFFNINPRTFDNNRAFGASVNYFLTRNFDLSVMGTYGTISYYNGAGTIRYFKSYMTQANVNLRYKFGVSDESTFRPYVFVGSGVVNQDNNGKSNYTVNGVSWMPVTGGAGINLKISDQVFLQYQITYGYWGTDKHDFLVAGDYNDAHLLNTVGIGFNLGQVSDADQDGVPDKKDKCANTPPGAKVDKDGCPFDRDNDGVLDYIDQCPDVAGPPATNGCPDRDGDGVADAKDKCPDIAGTLELDGCPDKDGDGVTDSEDQCPDVKGLKEFAGCPDTDGDGIQDSEDKCPDIKGLKQFAGCPDTDGDGIQDSEDQCPNVKGPASTNGCPDTDNDGLHDGIDKCPLFAGPRSNQGCPELKKEVKALFQKALQGIQFETGKAVIKPVSYPILDAVVKVMMENPSYKLLIGGHTDDVGNDASNMTLSQNRAESVAKYLIGKGVNPVRVSATGYGEMQPVDTNKSAAGRARNRRVELKVEFIEVIKE